MINVNLLYPIGSIYISINSTNPGNIFGGTWERIKGKMLVGVDEDDSDFNISNKTGGEKEVTLTVEQIPPHQHETYLNYDKGSVDVPGWSTKFMYAENANQTKGSKSKGVLSAGGGQAHNNMPPYYTVYIFVRTA